jgi:hypothetical protein
MDTVKIEITEDLIRPIIENKIKAAIVESLGQEKRIFENLVDAVINLKVNSQGVVDKYSSSNKYNFLDLTLQNAIKDSIKDAIKEFVSANQKKIKAEIIRQMNTKEGINSFVMSLLTGVNNSANNLYKMVADFKFIGE